MGKKIDSKNIKGRKGMKETSAVSNGINNGSKSKKNIDDFFAEALASAKKIGKKKLTPISAQEWKSTHHSIRSITDSYYSRIATTLQSDIYDLPIMPVLDASITRQLAMTLTAYFEDLISETGVWMAVKNLYRKKYGTWLPFYDCEHDDYFNDDINIEDLKFLTWQTLARCKQSEQVPSPYGKAIETIAECAFDFFVDQFESAPSNDTLSFNVADILSHKDYYKLRELCNWLTINNKLTATPYSDIKVQQDTSDLLKTGPDGGDSHFTPGQAFYMATCIAGQQKHVSMLSCRTATIIEQMARDREEYETADILATWLARKPQLYNIVSYESDHLVLSDCLKNELRVTYKSWGDLNVIKNHKSCMTALVRFGDMYWVNGLCVFSDVAHDFEEQIDLRTTETPPYMVKFVNDIIDRHDGRCMFYCRDMNEVSQVMGLPVNDSEGLFNDFDNILLVMDSEGTYHTTPNVCRIFADKDNPFYKAPENEAEETELGNLSLWYICNGDIPTNVAKYISEHDLLPHAMIDMTNQPKERQYSTVRDNLEFLCEFYRVPQVDVEDRDEDDDISKDNNSYEKNYDKLLPDDILDLFK